MCTFIVNDLDDVEKDKINHPERPLPSGEVEPSVVAILYFVCLASALLTIRFAIGTNRVAFFYYLFLIMATSYHHIIEYLPAIKPLYVGIAAAIPVLIIAAYYPQDRYLYWIALAAFLFMLGSELCKDVPDRPGDPTSFLHSIEPRRIATVAFAAQTLGLIIIALQIDGLPDLLVMLAMTLLLAAAFYYWFRSERFFLAITLMKSVNYLGLYFLL
jgi:geranylgeranylglycerol-phosphate geranylgeranyltransferase